MKSRQPINLKGGNMWFFPSKAGSEANSRPNIEQVVAGQENEISAREEELRVIHRLKQKHHQQQ